MTARHRTGILIWRAVFIYLVLSYANMARIFFEGTICYTDEQGTSRYLAENSLGCLATARIIIIFVFAIVAIGLLLVGLPFYYGVRVSKGVRAGLLNDANFKYNEGFLFDHFNQRGWYAGILWFPVLFLQGAAVAAYRTPVTGVATGVALVRLFYRFLLSRMGWPALAD